MPAFIALLRGVNVGGHNRVAMPALRELCTALGWSDVSTYIQSGNVIFKASGTAAKHEQSLSRALANELGLSITVVVRSAAAWRQYVESNPFPEAAAERPSLVALCLSQARPAPAAARRLEQLGAAGERVAVVGDGLWIDYPGGAGRSKLTPAVLERAVGAPVTARNWRTVLRLDELVRQV